MRRGSYKPMKKLILLFLLLGSLTASAQYYAMFRDRWNVVGYGGYFLNQQNTNENGKYGGLYADYYFLKTLSGFNLGLSGNMTWLGFEQNLSKYQGKGVEVGGRIVAGYFDEFLSYTHQAFFGVSAGIKYSRDNGESTLGGVYSMEQTDWLFSGGLDIDFLKAWGKHENLFPRSQLIVDFQIPLQSGRGALWDGKPIVSEVWGKGYYELLFKQTIVSWPWSASLKCDFKVAGLYHHERHGNLDSYGGGIEVSLHRKYKDDFFSVGLSGRYNGPHCGNTITFTFSAKLNIGPLI